MSIKLFRSVCNILLIPRNQHIRFGHHMLGKPPTIARNLKQRLEQLKKEDPTLSFKVDIGYPVVRIKRKTVSSAWLNEIKAHKNDPKLEKASRTKKLLIDLQQLRKDWLQTDAPFQIHKIAKHYGIYTDLYGDAYFMPIVPLDINYNLENDEIIKVYTGNVIKPEEASKVPEVRYDAEEGSLWTLVMTTPDGNLTSIDNEYCHWLVGNIPGNHINDGEELVDYLRPTVPYGIGYYRYIFVLYKQECYIDYKEYKKTKPCFNLKERNWKTLEFYRKYQKQLTPAGLAFFQSDWDHTQKNFYYNVLKTEVPVYRYDFPAPYIKKQKWFPLKQPFNLYLDKYRDPKEITKEFLLRKLKKVHPFQEPKPQLKYPLAHLYDNRDIPTWLKLEITKKKLGYGRVNDLDEY